MPRSSHWFYLGTVLTLMVIFPVLSIMLEVVISKSPLDFLLIGSWFLFWGIGWRLLLAGVSQVVRPSFTMQSIFKHDAVESHAIVRELGFANLCVGLTAVVSLFIPVWRVPAAFIGGLFLGLAGIQHGIKGPVGLNEKVAMISDLFLFLLMIAYLVFQIVP